MVKPSYCLFGELSFEVRIIARVVKPSMCDQWIVGWSSRRVTIIQD